MANPNEQRTKVKVDDVSIRLMDVRDTIAILERFLESPKTDLPRIRYLPQQIELQPETSLNMHQVSRPLEEKDGEKVFTLIKLLKEVEFKLLKEL